MAAGKFATQPISYEEFEPFCKWQRKEDRDILEIHLQDFMKEQLRVQISNQGILKIFGERPIDASKHTKFYKEVPVPSNKYDNHAIHAKFVNGCLIITLPKVRASDPDINETVSSSEPFKIDQTPKLESTTDAVGVGGGAKEHTSTPGGKALTECRFHGGKQRSMASRAVKVAVSLTATAAAVAVLVAYVVYMCKSTVAEVDD